MNSNVTIMDRNGNQMSVQGVSYITLEGNGVKHEYLFYTLNEIINGDLSKVYVAKVNEPEMNISDDEWENVKRAMLAITHQEDLIGLTYNKLTDDQGNGKVFNVEVPRKIALKMDKLLGLQDEYKLALSNPNSDADIPAVAEKSTSIENNLSEEARPEVNIVNTSSPSLNTVAQAVTVTQVEPQVKNLSNVQVSSVDSVPTSNVEVQNIIQATPADIQTNKNESTTEEQTMQKPQVVNNAPKVTVTRVETPSEETEIETPLMPNIVPMQIPSALEDGPAIVNNSKIINENTVDEIDKNEISNKSNEIDSVIFDQIINELNQIKNQNLEIKESIRKLTDNVANINTSLAGNEFKEIDDGMINTNNKNTTEEVPAISLTPNGQVIVPTLNDERTSAMQAVNVLSTDITSQSYVEQPAPQSVMVNQALNEGNGLVKTVPTLPSVEILNDRTVLEPNSINQTVNKPISPVINEQPQQVIPNVPVMSGNNNEAQIVVPNFDPNADLPPVVMPEGVSSNKTTSIINGGIVDPLNDINAQ